MKFTFDLTEIKGIGIKRAEVLDQAGIKSALDLVNSPVVVLSSKTGISEKFLIKWMKQANELLQKQ